MHMPQSFLKASCFVTLLWMFSWAFVHTVMERQKLLQKYNIPYERIGILNPPALHIMIAEKSVDIGYGGLTAMARARSEGKGTLVFFGIFSPVNAVLVLKDSPVKSLADLRGKRVGNFGGPGSATTSIIMAIAKRWYGLDLRRDLELIPAPGPALAGL